MLLGAIGTATAPTAKAAPGDVCATPEELMEFKLGADNVLGIQGPFPNYDGYGDDQDHNLLLQGKTYLFVIVIEDGDEGPGVIVNVSIDDEDGDADIESYANTPGINATFADLAGSGVDSVDLIPSETLSTWDDNVSFLNDLNEDWDVAPDPSLSPGYYNFQADTSIRECGTATDDDLAFITVTCDEAGEFEITAFEDNVTDNVVTNKYICFVAPTTVTLTATPATVEAVPAVGNLSHSLVVATLTGPNGFPSVPGWRVDWTVSGRCTIEALDEDGYDFAADLWDAYKITNPATGAEIEYEFSGHTGLTASDTSLSFNTDSNPSPVIYVAKSIAAAVLHCEGATPGVASVRAEVDRSPLSDLVATADVTVVGPPAFITMTAAPSKLVCGEKATILVTVTDAINQKVSDHTVVELITNFGGVIGGTGATLGFPGTQPVGPLSSGAAETFGGVATAYLLTSSTHVGAYEVVASAGGSNLGYYGIGFSRQLTNGDYEGLLSDNYADYGIYERNGYFSTPVVSSQVTVTCTAGTPAVTAPNTGTGTISPPNTGDAGLAAAQSSTASLFVIAGAVAFVLAGLASFGYARRS
jgi:hypothetical protein